MNNLEIWEKVRAVPDTAQKTISGGRLNGKTDINPMWRIKILTEQFGMCGVGWKYAVIDKRLEKGSNDEIAAFVDIILSVKVDGAWSEAIPGTGGSMFVAKESKGPFTSDECFKMALTDAISVACKALGVGADIYWCADKTKYDKREEDDKKPAPAQQPAKTTEKTPPKQDNITADQFKDLKAYALDILNDIELVRKCFAEMVVCAKVDKIEHIKQDSLTWCREFIGTWDATSLPFTLAPEA